MDTVIAVGLLAWVAVALALGLLIGRGIARAEHEARAMEPLRRDGAPSPVVVPVVITEQPALDRRGRRRRAA